jgi:hypothetical protein
MDRRIGTELNGRLEAKIADIGGDDASGSARSSQLNVEQA